MIELIGNRLNVSFPEVHPDANCQIEFQRTLRIPDDGREYPLPAGLGKFPLYSVEDYSVPPDWKKHGGVFLPMYQSEAMWLNFHSEYPFAVKVATGKINAITGESWSNGLHDTPQDYLALPDQRWIDGFCVEKGVVRQFVAAPLGDGHTVEEQLTGKAEWGGLQLIFYPMKAEEYRNQIEQPHKLELELAEAKWTLFDLRNEYEKGLRRRTKIGVPQEKLHLVKEMAAAYPNNKLWKSLLSKALEIEEQQILLQQVSDLLNKVASQEEKDELPSFSRQEPQVDFCAMEMGMAAGGKIRQEIYEDPWDISVWDASNASRCFVHLLNSATFKVVTGKLPPTQPITPEQYKSKGIPWFEYYADKPAVRISSTLAGIKSLATSMFSKGQKLNQNDSIDVSKTIVLPPNHKKVIKEGPHW